MHVDHGRFNVVDVDASFREHIGHALIDQADIGRGTADVDSDEIGMTGGAPVIGGRYDARCGPREDGRNRLRRHLRRADNAATGLHHVELGGDARSLETALQIIQIARYQRHQAGVETGAQGPLIFAIFADDVGGNRHKTIRVLGQNEFAGPAFVGRIAIGVDKRNRDGHQPHGTEIPRDGAHRFFIERGVFLPPKIEPARSLANEFQWHHAGWFQPPSNIAEVAGNGLPPDFQHLAVALRHH